MASSVASRALQTPIARTLNDWVAEAQTLQDAGRFEEAERIVAQVIDSAPNFLPALHLAGILSYKLRRPLEAIERLERAIGIAPDQAAFHRNLCEIYRTQSRLDEAIVHGRRAVELTPDDPGSHYNLGVLHYDRLEMEEAIASNRRALALDPTMACAHFELAEGLLTTGQFEEGWAEYEWRFELPSAPPLLPKNDRPLWDGRPMRNGTLVLIADQGFGDSIQFCRYIPEVAKLCPNLVVAGSAEMRPIIIQQSGIAAYYDSWESIPNFDAYCPLSGLPRLFRTELATIPATVPYVVANSEKAAKWRKRLDAIVPGDFRRIGLVWAGRSTHGNDFNRSMTLNGLSALTALEDAGFISLQMGTATEQIGYYYGRAPLINLGAEIQDFTDTMAILDGLDCVVAVDTGVAHLAGAMGKPTFMLVPYAPDWRWLLERSDTPWYPTVELFRQISPGSWTEPVSALASRLKRSSSSRGGTSIQISVK